MDNYSPLRYPGGKGKISAVFKNLIKENSLFDGTYIELYAGGAGVALSLLFNEYVSNIIINDLDFSIYSFWYSVINDTENLCKTIFDSPVNIDMWNKQKNIQKDIESFDILDIAFSTFFLNRTNYSGILQGGVIGGKNQQGKYKIDARYNRNELINRIQRIAEYSPKIKLTNFDAVTLIRKLKKRQSKKTLLYLDPPYYIKGQGLYLNYYHDKDHIEISNEIRDIDVSKWVITYDNVLFIKNLYKNYKNIPYSINYSAVNTGQGKEIIIFSDNIYIPKELFEKRSSKVTMA